MSLDVIIFFNKLSAITQPLRDEMDGILEKRDRIIKNEKQEWLESDEGVNYIDITEDIRGIKESYSYSLEFVDYAKEFNQ